MTIRLRLNIPNKNLIPKFSKVTLKISMETKYWYGRQKETAATREESIVYDRARKGNWNIQKQMLTSGLSVCVATILLSWGSSLIRFTWNHNIECQWIC